MKQLLGSLALVAALGSAAPALASDVTGDRYSPYRNPQAPARAAQVASATDDVSPARAPCACHCAKNAAQAATPATARDGR